MRSVSTTTRSKYVYELYCFAEMPPNDMQTKGSQNVPLSPISAKLWPRCLQRQIFLFEIAFMISRPFNLIPRGRTLALALVILTALFLASCGGAATPEEPVTASLPPTWTPTPYLSPTPVPPTDTPVPPTDTPVPTPTDTATPEPTVAPTDTPEPVPTDPPVLPTNTPAPPQPTRPPAPPTNTPVPPPPDPCAGLACKFRVRNGPATGDNGGGELKLQMFFIHSGVEGGQPQGSYTVALFKDGQELDWRKCGRSIIRSKSTGTLGDYNFECVFNLPELPGNNVGGAYTMYVLDGNSNRDSRDVSFNVPAGQGLVWTVWDQG